MKDFTRLIKALEPVKTDFKSQFDDIASEVDNWQKTIAKMTEEGRSLSISIVGVVKSGKSSLVNALLFNGDEVLPKAATPMTAALTYIRYAPERRVEFEFFTVKEWEKMVDFAVTYDKVYAETEAKLKEEDKQNSRRDGRKRIITRDRVIKHSRGKLTEEYVAAKELVETVARSGLDVKKYLRSDEAARVVVTANSDAELVGKMQDYVGANGKFTPIVCSTAIYLPNESLKGYEIVDTPGTNDPVIFRGARTSASLGMTDAVLAVSTASQFFSQSEFELLGDILPNKGVKNFILIASQYDLAVGEESDKIPATITEPGARLVEAQRYVTSVLAQNYHKRISDIAKRAGDAQTERWAKLVEAVPVCVSSLAYVLTRHWGRLTLEEKEQLEKFNKLVPGFQFTDKDDLEWFSQIEQVQHRLNEIKSQKEKIQAEKLAGLEPTIKKVLSEKLGLLKAMIVAHVDMLKNSDVAQLRKKVKEQKKLLLAGEECIKAVFDECRIEAHKKFGESLAALREAKQRYSKISERVEVTTKESTHDRGAGFLWHRSLFGTRYETRTRTIRTRYADTYEAVRQIESFVDEARKELSSSIDRALDRKLLKRTIGETVLSVLDHGEHSEADLALAKAQLQTVVNRLNIPDSDLGEMDYTRMITDNFEGGEVKNEDVDKLKLTHQKALVGVMEKLEKEFSAKCKMIEMSLAKNGAEFATNLVSEYESDLEKAVAELKDKESSLKRLKLLVGVVEKASEML